MKKLQRGFSIVTAIFLLVVLAGLGAAMLTFSNVQHQTAALDVMGSRAYQAARAGIEWGAYQIIYPTATPANCTTNFAPNSLGGTLAPFAVAVTCTAASHVQGATTVWIYNVNAVACNEAACPAATTNPNYIERSMSIKMGK